MFFNHGFMISQKFSADGANIASQSHCNPVKIGFTSLAQALVDLGAPLPPHPKFCQFHVVFLENLAKSYVGVSWECGRPSYRGSWIRPWQGFYLPENMSYQYELSRYNYQCNAII